MAVTITRSVWIDDDGSGTVGTVINQALHTTLYNEIDTALAKVAQLAGGNTFTALQVITPAAGAALCVNTPSVIAFGLVSIRSDLVGGFTGITVQNSNATAAGNFIHFVNSAGTEAGAIYHSGSTAVTYVTTSDARLKADAGRASDLAALRGVVVHDFAWKADGVRDRGVFAQEAAAWFPRAVVAGTDETTDDGHLVHPWMTDYSKFVPDLIVGWQQHDAELTELRAILAAVKG